MLLHYYISKLIQLVNFNVLFKIKPWYPGQDALNMSGTQWVKYLINIICYCFFLFIYLNVIFEL